MDELISKLRSQVPNTQNPNKKKNSIQKESSRDDDVIVEKEITTSQSDALPKHKFKLDFELLKKYKDNDYSISDVKEADVLKIEDVLWVLVKSIEVFKGVDENVYRLELVDDSGVIFGSSNVNTSDIGIGTVLCLKNCSIWKINGSHLNIVRSNIFKIIN